MERSSTMRVSQKVPGESGEAAVPSPGSGDAAGAAPGASDGARARPGRRCRSPALGAAMSGTASMCGPAGRAGRETRKRAGNGQKWGETGKNSLQSSAAVSDIASVYGPVGKTGEMGANGRIGGKLG